MMWIQRNIYALATTGIFILILPFFILSFFTHPSADDYGCAFMMRDAGFWNYQKTMYHEWGGRYSQYFTEFMNPLVWNGEKLYKLMPLFHLILLLIALFVLFKNFLKDSFSSKQIWLVSLIFYAVYLNVFPGISEGLYWFTGARVYLFGAALLLFAIGLVIKVKTGSHGKKAILYYFIIVLLIIVIAGMNELLLLLPAELVLMVWLWKWRLTRKTDSLSGIILLVIAGAAAFALTAPGNYARMSNFPNAFNIADSLAGSWVSLMKLFGIFFQNPAFVILTLLLVPPASGEVDENLFLKKLAGIHPLVSVSVSLIILYSLYLPGFLAMGINPPLRIHAFVALIFMLLWMINVFVTVQYFRRKNLRIAVFQPWQKTALILVTVILTVLDFNKVPGEGIYFRGNISRAWYDLWVNAVPYEQQFVQRKKLINIAKQEHHTRVEFAPLERIPATIHFIDITENPEHWINAGLQQYYKIDTIILQSKT